MKKTKIRQKKHYIFSLTQTTENEKNINSNREKHMKNGQKAGDFDVKRDNTGYLAVLQEIPKFKISPSGIFAYDNLECLDRMRQFDM